MGRWEGNRGREGGREGPPEGEVCNDACFFHSRTSREGGAMPAGSRKRAREEEEEEDGQSLPGEGRSDSQEAGGSNTREDGSSEGAVPQQPGGRVATVGEASSSDVLAVHHPHAIIANPVQVHVQDCHTIPSVCLSALLSACLSVCPFVHSFICLSVCSASLPSCLSVRPSICLPVPPSPLLTSHLLPTIHSVSGCRRRIRS